MVLKSFLKIIVFFCREGRLNCFSLLLLRFWLLETPYRIDLELTLAEDQVNLSADYNLGFHRRDVIPKLTGRLVAP